MKKLTKMSFIGFFTLANLCICLDPRAKPSYRLSFGSCYNHAGTKIEGASDIFLTIKDLKPDIFVWLGDFTYTDSFTFFGGFYWNNMTVIKERYDESYYDESKTMFFSLLNNWI